MAADVTMPKMGYDMEEGTILQWLKSEGDDVAKGDVLGEIETGKVNIEIEAFDEGVLRKILVGEGETVPVGTPIAVIGGADEDIDFDSYEAPTDGADGAPDDAAKANGKASGSAETASVERSADDRATNGSAGDGRTEGGRLRASPLARNMAEEHGLDLSRIEGSGPHGRVVRDDVQAAIESMEEAPAEAPEPAAAPVAAQAEDQREALSGMRRTIAKRLSESWRAAPHIFVTMAIEMDAAFDLRREINTSLEESGREKISVNDLVVKACASALQEHPLVNVSWDDGERVRRGRINIGVAVALDDGLMTIVLPDADSKSISALGRETVEKARRARDGELTPEDVNTPSTFTVSNMGMYGVEEFTAIINPPEAAILAVGAAVDEPVVREGEVVVRKIMRVTLSADHRVVDGATAAKFLGTVKQRLEQPLTMLV